MTKQKLKRICIVLLLALGVAFIMTNSASALLVDSGEKGGYMRRHCQSWSEYYGEYQGDTHCWPCKIFMFLFDSVNELAGKMNNALSGGMISLVVIGAVLWAVFYITMSFANVATGPEPMEFLTQLGKIVFRAGVGCVFLAGGASLVFDWFVNPILTSGAQLANMAANTTGTGMDASLPDNVGGSVSAGPMSPGVRAALKAMITQVSNSMAQGEAIAGGLRCGSVWWRKFSPDDLLLPPISWFTPDIFPPIPIWNPAMWTLGAWLGCSFWCISILFTFAMIDVVFRIGLLVGMLPVFVAAWVFPITITYTKQAWQMFINSVAVFFVTGVMGAFIVILINNAWTSGSESFIDSMQATKYISAWDDLFEDDFGKGLITIFIVIIMCWYGLCLAPKADGIPNKILGGDFSSSCAIKAIKKLIQFILDMIMLAFTIVTYSLGAVSYITKFFKYVQEAEDKVKKIKEIQDKIKKIQEKVRKIKEKVEKVKKAAEKAAKAIPDGDK